MPALHRSVAGEENSIRLLEDRSDVVDETWEPGATTVVGVYDSTGLTQTLRTFSTTKGGGEDGDTAYVGPSRFQLAYREISDEATLPMEIQVIASPIDGAGTPPGISATVRTKNSPTDFVNEADARSVTITEVNTPIDSGGWLALHTDISSTPSGPQSGRYHQFDVEITPKNNVEGVWRAAEIQGIMVRFENAGDY